MYIPIFSLLLKSFLFIGVTELQKIHFHSAFKHNIKKTLQNNHNLCIKLL